MRRQALERSMFVTIMQYLCAACHLHPKGFCGQKKEVTLVGAYSSFHIHTPRLVREFPCVAKYVCIFV